MTEKFGVTPVNLELNVGHEEPVEKRTCHSCGAPVTVSVHRRGYWTGLCARCAWKENDRVDERPRR